MSEKTNAAGYSARRFVSWGRPIAALIEIQGRVNAGAFGLELAQEIDFDATAIFGPSGAGKSVFLEFLAGFRRIQAGYLRFRGETLDSAREFLPPRRRRFGWVPQEMGLWPHLSVRQNIDYGLDRDDGAKLRDRAIELLELGALLKRRPDELSGGQAQRVALARAVASSPRLLLLDEPLSSLDIPLRGRIIEYIRRLQSELKIPFVYVSHDRQEVLALAEHVLIFQQGKCVGAGAPEHVFGRATPAAYAEYVRGRNRFAVTVEALLEPAGTVALRVNSELVLFAPIAHAPTVGMQANVAIDPSDIIISVDPPGALSAQNIIAAEIVEMKRTRSPVRVMSRHASGATLEAFVTPASQHDLSLAVGKQVYLVFKAHAVQVV